MRLAACALAAVVFTAAGCTHDLDLDHDAYLAPPPDDDAALHAAGRQTVYLHFDGLRVSDCDAYCSDAANNRSFVIGAHFGADAIDFPAAPAALPRAPVVDGVRAAFAPWDVDVRTTRPEEPPYTMVVLSSFADGRANGVAPLDCGNARRDDVVFAHDLRGLSVASVVGVVAHELGHSFGLTHVADAVEVMHWTNPGDRFGVVPFDAAHASSKCFEGDVQDAPALLGAALGGRAEVCPGVARAAGDDRFGTAAVVARRSFLDGADVAVLVSGVDGSPDALAAGPLAAALGAPILLGAVDALPTPTAAALADLGVARVVIVGGAQAIGDAVVDELRARGLFVERVAGVDRFKTAALVATRVGARDGLVYVASGEAAHLVDALAASGPAAALGAPILLVAADRVPAATADALAALGVTRTVVVGGPASVSDAVVAALPSPVRVAGADRFATAVAVAQDARARGVPSSSVFVARGDRMPDALAAGAGGRITLLSAPDLLPDAVGAFLAAHVDEVTLLGGPAALSPSVFDAACHALE